MVKVVFVLSVNSWCVCSCDSLGTPRIFGVDPAWTVLEKKRNQCSDMNLL